MNKFEWYLRPMIPEFFFSVHKTGFIHGIGRVGISFPSGPVIDFLFLSWLGYLRRFTQWSFEDIDIR